MQTNPDRGRYFYARLRPCTTPIEQGLAPQKIRVNLSANLQIGSTAMTRRQRMNVYFEPGLLKQVEALAERRKVSKSAVIEAAVLSLVSGEDDGRRDAALSKRLDRLGRRIDDVDEAVAVLGEAFALYTHAWMMRQLPIPANENEAAKVRGADMYARFNEVLVRRLATGRRFLNERVRDVAGFLEKGKIGPGRSSAQ